MITINTTTRTFGSYFVNYTDGNHKITMQISDEKLLNFCNPDDTIREALTDYVTKNS